jgi:hypothetical protein
MNSYTSNDVFKVKTTYITKCTSCWFIPCLIKCRNKSKFIQSARVSNVQIWHESRDRHRKSKVSAHCVVKRDWPELPKYLFEYCKSHQLWNSKLLTILLDLSSQNTKHQIYKIVLITNTTGLWVVTLTCTSQRRDSKPYCVSYVGSSLDGYLVVWDEALE